MNISVEIAKIKFDLEELQDENLIAAVKALLTIARKHHYESQLKPMSTDEYLKRAMVSEEDIKYGRITDIDDLEKESNDW